MTTPVPEVPAYAGCEWPVDPACKTEEWDGLDEKARTVGLQMASATLERLTGYRVTNCPVTVRPCKPPPHNQMGVMPYITPYGSFNPHLNGQGVWVNGCGHGFGCECSVLCEVQLAPPVGRVDEVKVDGNVLPVSDYRVDHQRYLVHTGAGDCPFPATQDLSRSDSEPGTFSVTYLNGHPPDSTAAYAAGVLAMEYAKACMNRKCALPSGVTNIVRQGVSIEVLGGSFPGGMTGIRAVDSFIALWNPQGLTREAAVWSPDLHRRGRR